MEVWQIFVIALIVLAVYGVLFLVLSLMFVAKKKKQNRLDKKQSNDKILDKKRE